MNNYIDSISVEKIGGNPQQAFQEKKETTLNHFQIMNASRNYYVYDNETNEEGVETETAKKKEKETVKKKGEEDEQKKNNK